MYALASSETKNLPKAHWVGSISTSSLGIPGYHSLGNLLHPTAMVVHPGHEHVYESGVNRGVDLLDLNGTGMQTVMGFLEGLHQRRHVRVHGYGLFRPFPIEPLPQTAFVVVGFNHQFRQIV